MTYKEIFGKNLKARREAKGYKQRTAALLLKITIKCYASYEEGRAEPPFETQVNIMSLFDIKDWKSFISKLETKEVFY